MDLPRAQLSRRLLSVRVGDLHPAEFLRRHRRRFTHRCAHQRQRLSRSAEQHVVRRVRQNGHAHRRRVYGDRSASRRRNGNGAAVLYGGRGADVLAPDRGVCARRMRDPAESVGCDGCAKRRGQGHLRHGLRQTRARRQRGAAHAVRYGMSPLRRTGHSRPHGDRRCLRRLPDRLRPYQSGRGGSDPRTQTKRRAHRYAFGRPCGQCPCCGRRARHRRRTRRAAADGQSRPARGDPAKDERDDRLCRRRHQRRAGARTRRRRRRHGRTRQRRRDRSGGCGADDG